MTAIGCDGARVVFPSHDAQSRAVGHMDTCAAGYEAEGVTTFDRHRAFNGDYHIARNLYRSSFAGLHLDFQILDMIVGVASCTSELSLFGGFPTEDFVVLVAHAINVNSPRWRG